MLLWLLQNAASALLAASGKIPPLILIPSYQSSIMDPVTQGAVGAVAAQLSQKHRFYVHAAVIGALGGMAPDLDVFIRSSADPLLALQFHRQFTHSLMMVPVLGALVGLLAYGCFARRWQVSLGQAMLWSTLGVFTHGWLDACTSYGTQLLWPFSEQRISWDLVSVVDPLFTLPLLLALFVAIKRQCRYWTFLGVGWIGLYLVVASVQQQRALAAAQSLVDQRGHMVDSLEVKPSFANLVVWKIVYQTSHQFHVAAVKPHAQTAVYWSGGAIDKLDVARDFPWLDRSHQQGKDIERFTQYSQGFVAVDPKDSSRVFDVRYSMLPDDILPMWGIKLSAEKSTEAHVDYFAERSNGAKATKELWDMIFMQAGKTE